MITSSLLHGQIKTVFNSAFPACIFHPEDIIAHKGFFPICNGTADGTADLSAKKVMVVGQDFGKKEDYIKAIPDGENVGKIATWVQLKPMLTNLGIEDKDCFFTNYLIGVRNCKTNLGPSPALENNNYVKNCEVFFLKQVEMMKPTLILFLGNVAYNLSRKEKDLRKALKIPYLKQICTYNKTNPSFENIPCYYLIHPCQRNLNISNGKWAEQNEKDLKESIQDLLAK